MKTQVYIIEWVHGYLNQKKLKPEHIHKSDIHAQSVEDAKRKFRLIHPAKIRILRAKPTGIFVD